MQSWQDSEAGDVLNMTMPYPMVTVPSGQGPPVQYSTSASAGMQQSQLNKGSPADFLLAGMPPVPYQSDKYDDTTSVQHSTQPECTAWNGPGFSRRLSSALPHGPAGRRSISSPSSQRTDAYIGSTFYQQSTQREGEQQGGQQGNQQLQQARSVQAAMEPMAVGLSDVYGLAQGKSAADLDELLLSDMLAEDDMSGAPVETGAGPALAANPLLNHGSLSQLLSEKEDKSAKEEKDADDVAADEMTEDADWKPGNLSGEEQPISGRKRRRSGGRSGGRAPNEDNRRSRRRESNRESARRSRARKLEEMHRLEEQIAELQGRLSEKEAQLQALRKERAADRQELADLRAKGGMVAAEVRDAVACLEAGHSVCSAAARLKALT